MSAVVDRMWDVRDALLLWLYEKAAGGDRCPRIDLAALHQATGWAADPITQDDLNQASMYLKAQGYIGGSEAFGAGIPRPMITAAGEDKAASGTSVRPGPERPANVTGVTNTYNITTNGPANVAVNSSDFTQDVAVTSTSDRLAAVADALEKYAADSPANADQAREVASEVRSASTDPEANKGRLLALLGSAISTVSIAAGSEIGQQVTQLAVGALQSLG